MSNKKVANYVKNRVSNLRQQKFGNINIFIKDHVTNDIDLKDVFEHVDSVLTNDIINLIDVVYVGDFDFLRERGVNAAYMDGAIYCTNEQDNKEDMVDDLIHEFAHAVENEIGYYIYSDASVEKEFLGKRAKLELMLNYEGYDTEQMDFLNSKYNEELDLFMYVELGREKLNAMVMGLFLRGYSTISLREYFATGFEEFYLGDRRYLKKLCPSLFAKLTLINENDMEDQKYEF